MKRIGLVVLLVGLCLGLTACGSNGTPKPCADVVAAVEKGQTFEEMTALSEAQILGYLALEEGVLSDMAMSIDASRATAETIAVLTAADEDGLKLAQAALTEYRDATMEQYRDYRPEEVPKLEGAVLETKGLQTVLIVSPDAAQAEKSLKAAW